MFKFFNSKSEAALHATFLSLYATTIICLVSIAMILLYPTTSQAQSKDCKFTDVKSADGKTLSMIEAGSKIGNFLVGKINGKVTVSYNTKPFYSMMLMEGVKNVAMLKIDSVQLSFDGAPPITLPALAGFGKLPNSNDQLQPQLMNITYSLVLVPGGKAEIAFRQFKFKGFRVFAQKDAKYGDQLNEKQQNKFLQALTCIQ